MTTRRIQRAALGVRVGGGGRFAGGSIGSGGVGARVGPVSVRTGGGGGRGSGGGGINPIGLLIVVAVLVFLAPIGLVVFSVWAYRRWSRAGRPAFGRLPLGEQVLLVVAGLAVPVAIALAAVVWGDTYTNMTNFDKVPRVSGDTVAEATVALEGAGFTIGDVVPTYGDSPVDATCEVRDVVASMDGRLGDKRVPVTLKVRC